MRFFPNFILYPIIKTIPLQKTIIPGEAIRKLRHLKGFKQIAAAKKLGISQQAYSKLERNTNLGHHKIYEIIKAFECGNGDFERMNGYPPRKYEYDLNNCKAA